jgi:hypothetical protein
MFKLLRGNSSIFPQLKHDINLSSNRNFALNWTSVLRSSTPYLCHHGQRPPFFRRRTRRRGRQHPGGQRFRNNPFAAARFWPEWFGRQRHQPHRSAGPNYYRGTERAPFSAKAVFNARQPPPGPAHFPLSAVALAAMQRPVVPEWQKR